jgi:hypothetical protein
MASPILSTWLSQTNLFSYVITLSLLHLFVSSYVPRIWLCVSKRLGAITFATLPLWSFSYLSNHVHLCSDGSSTWCNSKHELLYSFTKISTHYSIRVFLILQTSDNFGLPYFLSKLNKFSKTMAHFMSRLKKVVPFVVNIISNGDFCS